jgi:hypothetical protein
MARRPSEANQFQARISLDQEIVRAKVPSPLLRQMGARPGDYVTFHLADSGEAMMRLSRHCRGRKAGKKGGARKAASQKRGREPE